MPNGRSSGPFFRILPHKVEMASGITVFGYYVEMIVSLWVADEQPRFCPFQFHLDTKSDVTTVPEHWLKGSRRRFGVLSSRITARVQTAAGPIEGNGRMAKEVRFRFPGEAEDFRMDMLVSPSLETDYGLFSLRDLHNYYLMKTEGKCSFAPDGSPLMLGRVLLERRR